MKSLGYAGALCALTLSCGTAADEPRIESEALALGQAPAGHRFCGWLHGSLGDPAFTDAAYDTFAAHAADFDAVHPVWWRVESPTKIVNHPPETTRTYAGFHDARVLSNTTPGGKPTKLLPMIGASEFPDYVQVHRLINDAALREAHIRAIVALAVDNAYDGVDVDYEHLDPQHIGREMAPGETWATERRAFSGFIAELAEALHRAGKSLSLAVPTVASNGSVYDYDALSRAADQVHVMGYDYHYEGASHAGPVAPLAWIERAIAHIDSIDGGRRRGKFLLGVPNYGLVGPDREGARGEVTICDTSRSCAELAGAGYATQTDHMADCSFGDSAAGRVPNRLLPSGDRVFFEDLESLEERVTAARRGGLGGITYWAIGGEPGAGAFFDMVRRHYPR